MSAICWLYFEGRGCLCISFVDSKGKVSAMSFSYIGCWVTEVGEYRWSLGVAVVVLASSPQPGRGGVG